MEFDVVHRSRLLHPARSIPEGLHATAAQQIRMPGGVFTRAAQGSASGVATLLALQAPSCDSACQARMLLDIMPVHLATGDAATSARRPTEATLSGQLQAVAHIVHL